MRSAHEEIATVTLTSERGSAVCSCLFERDPEYLSHNRMSLLGVREDWVAFLKVYGDGVLNWSVHEDPQWFARQGSDHRQRKSGTAFVRSNGMASGVAINEATVQKFADLEILDYVETGRFDPEGSVALSTEFYFLQRPRDWSAYGRRYSEPRGLTRRGDWYSVGDLKLRLVSMGYLRDDRRLSDEVELLQLPGVEMTPRRTMAIDRFDEAADALWFCLRILISFRYRQLTAPLSVNRTRPGEISSTWSTVAVEPKRVRSDFEEPPLYGSPGAFFAKAAVVLLRMEGQRELLHAAAFGYASSFEQPLLEGRLTSCVEALERLVGAFEAVNGLERDVVPRKQWRKVGAALRAAVDGHGLDKAQTARLKRSLAAPAAFTLQDRIERMIHHHRRRWSASDRKIALGLGGMIKTRNDIVHGRMVEDHRTLQAEILRSRVLFEKLLLDLLGCHGFQLPGRARWMIGAYEHEQAKRSAEPA